jgi:hypothetical protein
VWVGADRAPAAPRCKKTPRRAGGNFVPSAIMVPVALALMLFAVATLLDATASRVLVLLVAIVLIAATLLPTMLTSLATMLLALSTVTVLLLAALVVALATLLLATLLLVHDFLLRREVSRMQQRARDPTVRNSIDLPEIYPCTIKLP